MLPARNPTVNLTHRIILPFLLVRIQLLEGIGGIRRSRQLIIIRGELPPSLRSPGKEAPYQKQMLLVDNHLLTSICQLAALMFLSLTFRVFIYRFHSVRSDRLHSLDNSLLCSIAVLKYVHVTVKTYLPLVQVFLPSPLVQGHFQVTEILGQKSGFSKLADRSVDDSSSFFYKYVLEQRNKSLTI